MMYTIALSTWNQEFAGGLATATTSEAGLAKKQSKVFDPGGGL
jgi:hypothetical protein